MSLENCHMLVYTINALICTYFMIFIVLFVITLLVLEEKTRDDFFFKKNKNARGHNQYPVE